MVGPMTYVADQMKPIDQNSRIAEWRNERKNYQCSRLQKISACAASSTLLGLNILGATGVSCAAMWVAKPLLAPLDASLGVCLLSLLPTCVGFRLGACCSDHTNYMDIEFIKEIVNDFKTKNLGELGDKYGIRDWLPKPGEVTWFYMRHNSISILRNLELYKIIPQGAGEEILKIYISHQEACKTVESCSRELGFDFSDVEKSVDAKHQKYREAAAVLKTINDDWKKYVTEVLVPHMEPLLEFKED